jgi:hypothetical protein
MNRTCLVAKAALVVGLAAFASNASAALTYFDAQIVDITVSNPKGSTFYPKNTVICDPAHGCAETMFTPLPQGPGTEGPPPTTQVDGNWTRNAGQPARGQDGLWNQRFNTVGAVQQFGNPDPSGQGTVYESHGNGSGQLPNIENLPTLKTTVNVDPLDVGTTRGVYAMFWSDGAPWHIHACLGCMNDDGMQRYVGGGSQTPVGRVFEVFDAGQVFQDPLGDINGSPDLVANYPIGVDATGTQTRVPPTLTMLMANSAGYTSTDAGSTAAGATTGRHFWAAYLGDVVLGTNLSVFVGDGPPQTATEAGNANGSNHRTWYDGIAYGDALGLERILCPEPTSFALLGLGLVGFGLIRRRPAC